MLKRWYSSSIGQPEISTYSGPAQYNNALSYLPGQRLSACTCGNDATHPGPSNGKGGFVGRGAPEIDMFEATVSVVPVARSAVFLWRLGCLSSWMADSVGLANRSTRQRL